MERFRIVLFALVLVSAFGCAHTVGWDPIQYEKPLAREPEGKVSLYMAEGLKSAEHSFRAFGSGIANKWVVPYGERVHQFAESYLSETFRDYSEVKSPQVSRGTLVNITAVKYTVSGQAARVTVSVEARDAAGKPLLSRSYSAEGPSGAGTILTGGAFAQQGMIRRSTNRALHEIFQQLTADLRNAMPR